MGKKTEMFLLMLWNILLLFLVGTLFTLAVDYSALEISGMEVITAIVTGYGVLSLLKRISNESV